LTFNILNIIVMKQLRHIALFISLSILAACNPNEKPAGEQEQHAHASHAPVKAAGAVILKDPDLDAVYQQYQQLSNALVYEDYNRAKLSALAIETGAD
jgi:hypothetical protein